jgi:hypothetical protein
MLDAAGIDTTPDIASETGVVSQERRSYSLVPGRRYNTNTICGWSSWLIDMLAESTNDALVVRAV